MKYPNPLFTYFDNFAEDEDGDNSVDIADGLKWSSAFDCDYRGTRRYGSRTDCYACWFWCGCRSSGKRVGDTWLPELVLNSFTTCCS